MIVTKPNRVLPTYVNFSFLEHLDDVSLNSGGHSFDRSSRIIRGSVSQQHRASETTNCVRKAAYDLCQGSRNVTLFHENNALEVFVEVSKQNVDQS